MPECWNIQPWLTVSIPFLECAMEYTGPVNELKEMCEIRIEVAGILRDCRVSIHLVGIPVSISQL